ncbi:putative membrane protein [Geobacillus sp. PA-3]|nr:putative membrane protein [Geobacillus sp. PA-3]
MENTLISADDHLTLWGIIVVIASLNIYFPLISIVFTAAKKSARFSSICSLL